MKEGGRGETTCTMFLNIADGLQSPTAFIQQLLQSKEKRKAGKPLNQIHKIGNVLC